MSRPKVFITRQLPQAGLSLLHDVCDVEINPEDAPLQRNVLLRKAGEVQGIIGLLTDKIDAEFLEAATGLKGYANYAVGYDNIDVPAATSHGIPVSNTPDVLTNATAELAWALLFAVARRVVESDRVMRSGTWPGWGPMQFLGADVRGKTLGIFGGGRIGAAMAMMSKGFDMRVLYTTNSSTNPELEREVDAKRVDFDTLLAESDFISIHAPLTPGTRHLFNAETFKKMKKTAYVINTGRGPIIKEDDLVAALGSGEIAGAGLDVYEFEPRMAKGLAEQDNAVILPHVGSATTSTRIAMAELATRNILAMLEGKLPPTCLNPELFSR